MSDKSFGDHAYKNIVKNPLLCTAVTGLSIEDLTHNAVLVPVAHDQGLITGSDPTGTYIPPQRHTDHEITSSPSGDSNSNILLPQPSISPYSQTIDSETIQQHHRKPPELPTSTVSKVSAKSEDDFDVNEYFARLQGTRYVSAPLHSHPDPNPNLATTEDNLEEINLNDDKTVEVQHSLTADIAQNFSQLPNVLPHVASAVFSSFSNMWNMKSREHTPDDRSQSYHDVQFQETSASNQFQSNQGPQGYQDLSVNPFQNQSSVISCSSVPLMNTESIVKEMAPPPRKPPIGDTTSFRLTTKKKYAQIPGLSTGESQQIAFNPVAQNVPSYFIPTQDTTKNIDENAETTPIEHSRVIGEEKSKNVNEIYNIFNPVDVTEAGARDSQPNVFMPTENLPKAMEEFPPAINLQSQMPSIPPPPMFSNQKRETQSAKLVLPPSVARRIGSNHPVIKQQIIQPNVTDNIFVPTFDPAPTSEPISAEDKGMQVPTYTSQMFTPSSNQSTQSSALPPIAPPQTLKQQSTAFNAPPTSTKAFPSMSRPDSVSTLLPTDKSAPLMFNPATASATPAIFTSGISDSFQVPQQQFTESASALNAPPTSRNRFPLLSGADSLSNVLPTDKTAPHVFNPAASSGTPAIFTPGTSDTATDTGSQPPSSIFMFSPPGSSSVTLSTSIFSPPPSVSQIGESNSSNIEVSASTGRALFPPPLNTVLPPPGPHQDVTLQTDPVLRPPILDYSQKVTSQPPTNTTSYIFNTDSRNTEPPKALVEPPKAIGASNFRMTKKRPQYYSGPIEGFGSISNSIKPVIPTVEPATFQGALFTPEQPPTEINTPSFDISKKADSGPAYSHFEASLPAANLSMGPHVSQQPTYQGSDLTQGSQAQYTTAFDFSRPDDYEPKETKGFGIIGSLRSKLGSLDINKIQSTVTTFFDPGYNDAKKDDVLTRENLPYNPLQYHAQTRGNFEIYVPNFEQNAPYDYNYHNDQNAHGQTNQDYSQYQDYSKQPALSYGQPYGYQPYPPDYNSNQTQNLTHAQMSNLYGTENTAEKVDNEPTKLGINPIGNVGQVATAIASQNIGNQAETNDTSQPVIEIASPKSYFGTDLSLPQHGASKREEHSFGSATSHVTGGKVFDAQSVNPVHSTENKNSCGINPADASKENTCSMPAQPIRRETKSNTFANVLFDDKEKSYTLQPNVAFDRTEKEVTITNVLPKLTHDVKEKEVTLKNDNLLESLTKAEVPILAVSTVPLFGLSAIIADNTKESKEHSDEGLQARTKNIDILDRNAGATFFDNKAAVDRKHEDHDISRNIDYILNTNPNVTFFNRELETRTEVQNTQIPSMNLFTNDQKLEKHDTAENVDAMLEKASSLFENIGAVTKDVGLIQDTRLDKKENVNYFKDGADTEDADSVSELNICETCREVNKPEDRELERDDLTLQLIENITSPIQLLNPVEVPLPEDNSNERVEFDADQFEEISHITEETIETIHVQSANELLEDDDIKIMNFGWATDNNSAPNPLEHHTYGFKVDPNTRGFFEDSLYVDNVPTNASDELKAEYIHQEDLLPRQMSMPSAPPEEEDSKSDEAGTLDVHSIELDAKEDFPIYEEFVIEPSETDDDKIEYKKTEESNLDSFTNRVEKFKKMEEVPKFYESASQQISMASYFDTGNYAEDTHYRNTITSPNKNMSIPPGFEEEFKKRLALAKAKEESKMPKKSPDTQTQTRPTVSVNFCVAQSAFRSTHSVLPVGFNVEADISKLVEDNTENRPITSIYGSERVETPDASSNIASGGNLISEAGSEIGSEDKKTPDICAEPIKLPEKSVFGFGNVKMPEASKISDMSSAFRSETSAPPGALPFFGSGASKMPEPLSVFGFEPTLPPGLSIFGAEVAKMSETSSIIGAEATKIPTASSIFGSETVVPPGLTIFGSEVVKTPETSIGTTKIPAASSIFCSQRDMPETSDIFLSNEPKIPELTFFNPTNVGTIAPQPIEKKPDVPKLPDPMNFFADTSEPTPSENFNRLASYFSSPPKTDHAKSFFELSQSQNHYKHQINPENYDDLIKDLTSVQNLAVPTDQTIRHVNYFTIEYDSIKPEFNKGDNSKDILINVDDRDIDTLLQCQYCATIINNKRFKVKTAMNDNNQEKDSVPNMEPTSSKTRNSVTVDFDGVQINEESNEAVDVQGENRSSSEYSPVKHHWFYRVDVEEKSIWRGFSVLDSRSLETAYLSPELNENTLVPTDGGRYDVNLVGRLRIPVYWSHKPTNVRRCSWFYKGTTDLRYVPYTETVAEKLEEEYLHGITTGEWHRRLLLSNGEVVVMHGPTVMVHFMYSDTYSTPPISQLFSFGKRVYRNPPKITVSRDQPPRIDHLVFLVHGAGEYRSQKEKIQSSTRPRVVRRGHDDSEIEDAEPSSIDHLLLLCHGVGSACDMRFRSVEEVVEDFRTTSLQLIQSHYKNSFDQGVVSRVEVLPISWHASLHSGETGVDRRLAQITLDSIPRLRNFTNDTVLDVLFYTSPVFGQIIVNTVCQELNRIYQLFKKRNPSFKGGISLGGHSLGSVILYDLLCHQLNESERRESVQSNKNYVAGPAGTGRPGLLYPQLQFQPSALYALGSPIAIFECIRGVESLGTDFALPTCKNFFNIFHPYDPIAYRIEPLINPRLQELKPYLIPHHKGRKRMHLELKDTMARVGADLKQKLVESLRSTWNKWKSVSVTVDGTLEKVEEEDVEKEQLFDDSKEQLAKEKELSTPAQLGRLNDGRRVDYVLQEAPLEMINEYLFAMSSHVGYWESEDTMLLMLREIYSSLGVQPDSTVPQQSMIVERTKTLDMPCTNSDVPSTSGHAP